MRRSIIYAPFRDFIIMLGGIMRSRKHNAPQHKLRTLSQIIMCGRTICPPQAYCAGVVCALLCALHAGALYARVHTLCLRRSMHCAHGIRMKALVLRLASYAFGRQNCDDSTVEKTTRAPGRGRSDFAAVHRLLLMRVLYSPAAQTVRTVERCGVDAISALS